MKKKKDKENAENKQRDVNLKDNVSDISNNINEQKDDDADGEEKTEVLSKEEELQKLFEEQKDKNLRLYAEFENFRKRTRQEKEDLYKNASQRVINDILPVIDDFERAIATIEKSDDIVAIKEGVDLILKKLTSILIRHGLKPMDAVGTDFNSDFHEAVSIVDAEEDMKGKIIEEIEKGYLLNDKIIRFSKVIVGK